MIGTTMTFCLFDCGRKTMKWILFLEQIKDNAENRKALIVSIRFRRKVLKQAVKDKKLYYVSETRKQHSVEKLKENVTKLINEATERPS